MPAAAAPSCRQHQADRVPVRALLFSRFLISLPLFPTARSSCCESACPITTHAHLQPGGTPRPNRRAQGTVRICCPSSRLGRASRPCQVFSGMFRRGAQACARKKRREKKCENVRSRSRLAGKAIYFVTRAKILEEAASIGNQANCSRFCANLAIAIITAHTKSSPYCKHLAQHLSCRRQSP